jgi:uncharacterized protein YjbI with pentapeptide repeats
MADEKLLQILRQGVEAWNESRGPISQRAADPKFLRETSLKKVNLFFDLPKLDPLDMPHIIHSELGMADLSEADLSEAKLSGADFQKG